MKLIQFGIVSSILLLHTSAMANQFNMAFWQKRGGATLGTWQQEAYIKAANADASDNFGTAVQISGDTLMASSFIEASSQTTITNGTTASTNNTKAGSGAVYVYKRTGSTWVQEAYIKAVNADAYDFFGVYATLDADTLAVSAGYEDGNQTTITNGPSASTTNTLTDSGAVYVYKRTGTTWAQEAYIKASNANANDVFGSFLDLQGDTLAVAAQGESSAQTTITNGTTSSTDNSKASSGAVYVYKRTGTTWAQEAYIKASNSEANDNFGISISISIDTLAIGANMEDSAQTTITNGTTSSADNTKSSSGAVYIYKRSGTTWAQEAYIKAANSDVDDSFGTFLTLEGDILAVSSFQEDSNQTTITNGTGASADNSASSAGAVYVYKRTGTTWAQEAYIKASNANSADFFGYSVSISGNLLAIGASGEDSNQTTITNGSTSSADNSLADSGAVYIYQRVGSSWVQEAYIKASNAGANDQFGYRLSLNGSTLAVSTPYEDSNQITITNGTTASADNSKTDSGAVYVYRRL